MIPRYIELNYFRGHEHEAVALEASGTYHLAGTSGFGKSSFIIDALAYVLFGARATGVKHENLRNRYFPDEAMSVRVSFEFDDGGWMTVERGLTAKGKPEAVVYEVAPGSDEARIVEEGPAKVQRYINRRLGGMTWYQFYSAFVCKQDELNALIKMTGKERQDRYHGMVGLHEVKKAGELLDSDLRTARAHIATLERKVGDRTEQTEAARCTEAAEAAALEDDRARKAVSLLEGLRADLAAGEQNLAPMVSAAQAADTAARLDEQIAARQSTLTELDRQLERQQAVQVQLAQRDRIEAEHRDLAAQVSQLHECMTTAETARRLRDRHVGALEALNEAKARVGALAPATVLAGVRDAGDSADDGRAGMPAEDMRARIGLLRADMQRSQAELDDRRQELETLTDSGQCPTCLRGLGDGHDHDRILATIAQRIAALTDSIDAAQAEADELSALLPDVERRERNRQHAEQQLAAAQANLDSVDRELAALSDSPDVADVRAQLDECSAREAELAGQLAAMRAAAGDIDEHAAARAVALRDELAALTAQRDEARATIPAGFDRGAVDELSQQVAQLRDRVAKGEGKVPEILRNAQAAQRHADAVAADVANLAADLRTLTELRENERRIVNLRSYLAAFQRKIVSDIRPALEEITSEMLQKISNTAMTAMRVISDDYDMEVELDGVWVPAPELSGGEKARLAICLRLALTHLVSSRVGVPIQFLIFDEPFGAQGSENREEIMELLSALRGHYKQIFLTSHVGDLSSSDHVDFVLDVGARRGRDRIQLFAA